MARVEGGNELLMLLQKQRGLELLIRYERDVHKLKFYCKEFALVTSELNKQTALSTRTKDVRAPFARKPLRSA